MYDGWKLNYEFSTDTNLTLTSDLALESINKPFDYGETKTYPMLLISSVLSVSSKQFEKNVFVFLFYSTSLILYYNPNNLFLKLIDLLIQRNSNLSL